MAIPRLVKDLWTGSYSSNPEWLTASGGSLYFSATDSSGERELWKTDGTSTGTVKIDIADGLASSFPTGIADAGGILFLTATRADGVRGLWKYAIAGGKVFIKSVIPTASNYFAYYIPVNLNIKGSGVGRLLFSSTASTTGDELWASDGTESGTVLLSDIISGPGSSQPRDLVTIGQKTYFKARSTAAYSSYGPASLWETGGTQVSTLQVDGFTLPGFGPADEPSFVPFGNKLLVWKRLLLDPQQPFGPSSYSLNLLDQNGIASEIFNTSNILPNSSDYVPRGIASDGVTAYFSINSGFSGVPGGYSSSLWRTQGIPGDAQLVKEFIGPGASVNLAEFSSRNNSVPGAFLNGKMFFVANDGVTGQELWAADGTGAYLVKDLVPGSGESRPRDLTIWRDHLYFRTANHLYQSDGTAAGTIRIEQLDSDPARVTGITIAGDKLYFVKSTAQAGQELWVLDAPVSRTDTYTGDYDWTLTGAPGSGRITGEQLVTTTVTTGLGKRTRATTVTTRQIVVDETLTSIPLVNITGGASPNTINASGWTGDSKQDGGGSTDLLIGGTGFDTYTGGVAADRFRLLRWNVNRTVPDQILDFISSEQDKIEVSISGFGIVAQPSIITGVVRGRRGSPPRANPLSVSLVTVATAGVNAALATNTLFVYDNTTGDLWLNQDWSTAGVGSGGVIANLKNMPPTLTTSGISLIS
jgi:ELWxxDGT repeat protein